MTSEVSLRNLGLAGRIILAVALGLAGVLSLFGYLALAAVQQSKDQVLQQRLALSETMAGHIDYTLGRVLRQLEETAGLPSAGSRSATTGDQRQILQDAYHKLGAFATLELVARNGTLVWTEPSQTESLGSNVSGLPHIRRLFLTGSPAIDLVSPASAGQSPTVALTVPLWDQGTVIGAVVGKLSLARVGLDSLPAPNLGPTGRSELIAGTGLVIASSDASSSGSFVDHVGVLKDLLEKRQPGITLHRMPAGSPRPDHIVAYAPLVTLPWGIVVEQDQDEALALPQELQTRMLLSALLAMLVAGLVAWVGVRRLVKPLRTLTLAAQQMASGNLDEPLRIKRGDEVGALARSFEAMRVKLKASLDEIRRWNQELEKRVETRTAEVERRNKELSVLNSLARTVNSSLDLQEVLVSALDQVLTITEAEVASISLKDEHAGALSRRFTRSADGARLLGACPSPEECLCGRVALSGEPMVAGRISKTGGAEDAVCLQNGFQSLVILPLSSKEKAQGALLLASSEPDHFAFPEQKRLLAAVSHQIGIAVENARLYEEIQRREDARRQLLAKVITAQEEERKRIARELHDESAQALTALIMSIQAAQDALPEGLGKEKDRLARTKAQAIHALVEMRQMILDLRPTALDDLGLVPAIRWYAETHLQPLGIQSSVDAGGMKRRLPLETETSLFRIFQEAINNIARHSGAKKARVSLDIRGEEIHCIVEDDGVGFDAGAYAAPQGSGQGLGLLGVKERVSLLEGSLAIESAQGKGTRFTVTIPLRGE